MFAQLYIFTFFAALAAALTIDPLIGATTQGPASITWHNDAADTSRFAAFSVFLHHPTFRDDFALLNNVRPADGNANITLPVVPSQSGYTLRATNVGNISDVFAESTEFFIGEAISTSSTLSSTSVSSIASGSGTFLSQPPSATTTSPPLGTTLSNGSTVPRGGSTTSSGTSAANTATTSLTNFNGASRLGFDIGASSIVLMVLSTIAGGLFVGV